MAIKPRVPKLITDPDDIRIFLTISEKDLTTSFIAENFGIIGSKSKFNPYDEIDIPIGSYGSEKKKNKNKFRTTLGKWIFNKIFIEPELFELFQYIQDPINKKFLTGFINNTLSEAVIEDMIPLQSMKNFLMKTQKFMPHVVILTPNHSLDMLTIAKPIKKRKDELAKQYAAEIAAGDSIVASKIEKELLELARELLKDDPAMDSYNSGAGGSFENNFKNMYIMKGAIKDPDPLKGFNIALSNYTEGISKEEYAVFANSLAAGPFSRANKTQIGGYWEKLFMSATQHLVLDPRGSDCGTDRAIKIKVTKDNISDIMYCYVKQGNSYVEITSVNKSSFIGKTVDMRFASLCQSKTGFCNKCAGNLFYRIGIKNIGAATPQIASRLKVNSMKGFHDSTVKLTEMDPMKAFMPEN